ncbi:MAG: NAD(P)/FAD-dependent oxidoreductase [bacterium]
MLHNHYDIIIIGAGPAGLIAAIESHDPSKKIMILEKMHKPALKLLISGKGRCNITNSVHLQDFISHFGKNGRFLKFAFSEFFNTELLKYFENMGVQFKLERGGRYFSQDDDSAAVSTALLHKIHSLNISLLTQAEVIGITKPADGKFTIKVNSKNAKHMNFSAGKVVLATGGKSYPQTGSSGTGYRLASELGHTIIPPLPSLTPIETKGNTAHRLEGLSLRNVSVKIWCNNKKADELFGEMVFTGFGVSGPIILTLSRTIIKLVKEKQKVSIGIDLKPALDYEKLDQRLLREINAHGKQSFKSLLKKIMPNKLIPIFIEELRISESKQLCCLSADERKRLKLLAKDFRFEVAGYKYFDHAIITAGGICIQEINPQTMESKLVRGLYFAGEIIDIDADTGGFNLQAAFSTGWIAGRAIRSI